MRKLAGLGLMLLALFPILIVVLAVIWIPQLVVDLQSAVNAPLGQINSGLNDLRTTYQDAQTKAAQFTGIATQIAQTVVAPLSTKIASIPDTIQITLDHPPSIKIPVPTLTYDTDKFTLPPIDYPGSITLNNPPLLVTQATYSLPSVTYPSSITVDTSNIWSPKLVIDNTTIGLPSVNYPSSVSLNQPLLIVKNSTFSPPPIPYPSNIRLAVGYNEYPFPPIPTGGLPIPGLKTAKDLLNQVLAVPSKLSDNLSKFVDAVKAPFRSIDQAVAAGRQLAAQVQTFRERIGLIMIAFAAWFLILTFQSTLQLFLTGWRLFKA